MRVLDKGSITLIDKMGDDLTPAKAARVSFGNGSKGAEADARLTRYLMEHGHTSPFEMIELVWEVKAPIFVARQWMRYRTANVNEFSMRYAEPGKISEDEIDIYIPAEWRSQDRTNKQGSSAPVPKNERIDAEYTYEDATREAVYAYQRLLSLGVAREQARMVLPVSVYTKFVWKNDMHNTLHFIEQRTHATAQWEIRQYAEAMLGVLRAEFPLIISTWESIRDVGT